MSRTFRNSSPALAIALAFSCGAHLWRSLAPRSDGTPSVRHQEQSASSASSGTSLTRPSVPGAPTNDPLSLCSYQLQTARAELATATENLAQRTDPSVRFNGGAPEPEMEKVLTPLVANAVSRVPGAKVQNIECRSDVCKIRIGAGTRAAASEGWKAIYSDKALQRLSDGFSSSAGEPVVDLATGEGGFDMDLYVFTRSATDISAELQALVETFRSSGSIESCSRASNQQGTLEVRLTLQDSERTLSLTAGGTLAPSDLGRCIIGRLSEMTRSYQIPSTAKFGDMFATFVSPHGA